MSSRRQFLAQSAVAAAALASTAEVQETPCSTRSGSTVSLCGKWSFQIDSGNVGTKELWSAADYSAAHWREVTVPHTWQIEPAFSNHRGVTWYRRAFDVLPEWRDSAVRVEFEAVFHSATVWINGELVGEHTRKGYTAFQFDITTLLRWDQPNIIAVRVNNAFNDHMLPRGQSSDWANDGGIYRPVHLLVTPKAFIEQVSVEAVPNLATPEAAVTVTALCRNTSAKSWSGTAVLRIIDDETGLIAASASSPRLSIEAGSTQTLTLRAALPHAKLWHFDAPHLYRAEVQLSNGQQQHEYQTTFGVREFAIKDGKFHLNGEPVRLMGVERMAGSNPDFGMAEPSDWIEHDHRDLRNLNCIFTRVHWPQDRRVLDYCDRHGILMQSEIPTWGSDTFADTGSQPNPDLMQNGLEQLREMIQRDRNHPSIVAWGLCNEIDGQNPAAYQFAKRMLEEAKRLDPARLCSYASNSLLETPQRDAAGLMDFIETNEYFGTWFPGSLQDLDQHFSTLHATFPGKPIVVSEYGYCACTPNRPEGDAKRIEIMRTHTEIIRSKDFIGGAIFFCYNDYRTHMGDRGVGPLQQRVHGVVDVYGARKPSYAVLRDESSPISALVVERRANEFHLSLKTRATLPSYTLRGYKIRAILYGDGNIPVELKEVDLPELVPGKMQKSM